VADKNAKEKKPNGMQRWWRETTGELHKVTWPSRQEALRMTWTVLAVMIVVGGLLGGLDRLFTILMAVILGTSS
jgi:preprotein translocase subunit SecE